VSIADFDKAANQILEGCNDNIVAFHVIGLVIENLKARLFIFRRDEES
jgi:hypothetical protein